MIILLNLAKDLNLEVIQDEVLNVIIKKPGTKGYENAQTVIIQGHMDMVCEKNKGTNHDFEKDSLKVKNCRMIIFMQQILHLEQIMG